MTLPGVGPVQARAQELGLGPVRALGPVPVQVSVPEPEQERVQVRELEPVQVQVPELVLASAARWALVLCRKRVAKCAARCRPGSDWQCC